MQPIESAAFPDPDHWRSMFDDLPLLVEGESKVIRVIDDQTVIVRLKPTLFSYSANRAATIGASARRSACSRPERRKLWRCDCQLLANRSALTPLNMPSSLETGVTCGT